MKQEKETTYILEMVDGVEGPSLYLNDRRICGPKPWGGGKVIRSWKVDKENLLLAMKFEGETTESLWRCKRCGQMVDPIQIKCGCAESPSPWERVE